MRARSKLVGNSLMGLKFNLRTPQLLGAFGSPEMSRGNQQAHSYHSTLVHHFVYQVRPSNRVSV